MTAIEIAISAIALLLTVAAVLIADGRSRARNEVTAEKVLKLEGLMDRVTTLEANAANGRDALERHYRDDMAALATINLTMKEFRAEVLAAIGEVRADLRAREDTSPGRK